MTDFTVPRTGPEQQVIDEHAEWMRKNALGLRRLDLTRMMGADLFGSEAHRQKLIEQMGIQIALDAFKRGLGVITLSSPRYLIHRHVGAWEEPSPALVPEDTDWLSTPPSASTLEPRTLIEIKIEAFGFPIGKHEA